MKSLGDHSHIAELSITDLLSMVLDIQEKNKNFESNIEYLFNSIMMIHKKLYSIEENMRNLKDFTTDSETGGRNYKLRGEGFMRVFGAWQDAFDNIAEDFKKITEDYNLLIEQKTNA